MAGGPVSAHASDTASTWTRRTTGLVRPSTPSEAPAPEYSSSGATTVTSPWSAMARAR